MLTDKDRVRLESEIVDLNATRIWVRGLKEKKEQEKSSSLAVRLYYAERALELAIRDLNCVLNG
jgi:hypothetical protein